MKMILMKNKIFSVDKSFLVTIIKEVVIKNELKIEEDDEIEI